MVTRDRGSEEADPVQDHSSLSLFLKTFELSEDASEPYDFDLRLQSVQNSLKSTVSRSPDKLRELARNIVNESSKNLSSKPQNDQVSMEKHSEVLPVVAEVYPRERRPGLGSKRARFFIKPDSSQHVVNIEPKLDVKNLSDPEEFFKVHERRENAKKEIQRQMGVVLSDSELQNTSLTNRPRRPGLLDRNKRIAKYKHLYPSDDFETNSNLVSSQEKIDSNILNHESHGSEEGSDRDFASQGTELAGSISAEVEKADEILDQLLSSNSEEFEGDHVMSVLRERLQIKPIELPKLNLPDFPEMPKMNVTSAKLRFSSITQTNVTQGSESSVHVVASPKSPFASLPSLNRRILRSSPSSDPFSAHAIDLEPITSSSIEQLNKEFSDAARQSTTDSPLPEVDKNIELPSTSKTNLDKTLDVGPHLTGADDMDINTNNGVVNAKLVAQDVDVSTQANETVVQDKVSSVLLDAGSSASHLPRADDMDISMDNGFVNDKLVAHDVDGSTQANETNVQAEVEDEVQGMADTAQPHSITEDVALNNGSEEHIEINQEQSKEPLDKKRKAKSQSGKAPKRREVEMRKSLAGAGTTWEAGLRRSTRIRFRPLEHWKGERLVFGRVHNSLPTVIGLKYASPGKSGALKVKSYVSDEYKELLELAALH